MVDPSIGAAARPTLVVVGAASRDIDPTDPRGWRLGGTVTYSSLIAARLGLRVRALVGVDSNAASAHELEILRADGVELRLIPIDRGPVFDNRQTPRGREQHVLTESHRLPIDALPVDWRAPSAALLGPVAGELGAEWAGAFNRSSYVALAAQGLVRHLQAGAPVRHVSLERSALTERADAIFVSAEDIAAGAQTVRELLRPGQTLFVTHGERGALVMRRHEAGMSGRYVPSLPKRRLIDTTGAGDTFLAAWLAARLLTGTDDWRASAVAAAAAGLSVERRNLKEAPTLAELCEVLVRQRDRHPD